MYKKLNLHKIDAIIIPMAVPNMKLIITSYDVINIWWKSEPSLYSFITVFIISFGLDEINVFIQCLFASICHMVIIIILIDI